MPKPFNVEKVFSITGVKRTGYPQYIRRLHSSVCSQTLTSHYIQKLTQYGSKKKYKGLKYKTLKRKHWGNY